MEFTGFTEWGKRLIKSVTITAGSDSTTWYSNKLDELRNMIAEGRFQDFEWECLRAGLALNSKSEQEHNDILDMMTTLKCEYPDSQQVQKLIKQDIEFKPYKGPEERGYSGLKGNNDLENNFQIILIIINGLLLFKRISEYSGSK